MVIAAPPLKRSREVVKVGEVWLESRDPVTGLSLRRGRFKLVPDTTVQPTLQGLQPPVIAIGEQGRDSQPLASSVIIEDIAGGIGIERQTSRTPLDRSWWSTADGRRAGQITLNRKAVDRGKPADVTTQLPTHGGVFNDRVWVSWAGTIRQYSESGGWTAGAAAGDTTLAGGTAGDPVEYEGGWFWPRGAAGMSYWNGAAWATIATPCVGLLVYAGQLWGVSGAGQVYSLNIGATAANAEIAAGTLAPADFTDRVKISDVCSGLLAYLTADADADVVPYVIGHHRLYQVDPLTFVAQPAGPQLPPFRSAMRAAVLGGDLSVYLAQGMTVTNWTGEIARPVGLDQDDGVPIEARGIIGHLLNGGQTLFGLVDATAIPANAARTIEDGSPGYADVMDVTTGSVYLAGRGANGWHIRAISLPDALGPATILFGSEAELTHRVWFGWGGSIFSQDQDIGAFNPLDDPTIEYEQNGQVYYPRIAWGYLENHKLALLLEIRAKAAYPQSFILPHIAYDDGGWLFLTNDDGTQGIKSPGRHSFLLPANYDVVGYNPLTYPDDPPVGRACDYVRIWLSLVNVSGDPTLSPAIEFVGIHAIKVVSALTAWRLSIDLRDEYNGLTPWQQRALLMQLIQDNERGLLHFAYRPDPALGAGAPDMRPVKVINFSGNFVSGLAWEFKGQVTLVLSEVVRPVSGDPLGAL